jgi:hypothetical protein
VTVRDVGNYRTDSAGMQRTSEPRFLVDGHVHLYPTHDLTIFLDGALANFEAEARKLRIGNGAPHVLLFASTDRARAFPRLEQVLDAGSVRNWTISRTKECASLLARHTTGRAIILIDGRQLVTDEGIEVLGLCWAGNPPQGLPLKDTIELLVTAGAVPVVPWGFGKWWLGRGSSIRRLLDSDARAFVHLGDSAARPRWTPEPLPFKLARQYGMHILPGTDPLPLREDAGRAGSYGFVLGGELTLDSPARDLKSLIRRSDHSPRIYGERDRLLRFLSRQIRLRMGAVMLRHALGRGHEARR